MMEKFLGLRMEMSLGLMMEMFLGLLLVTGSLAIHQDSSRTLSINNGAREPSITVKVEGSKVRLLQLPP